MENHDEKILDEIKLMFQFVSPNNLRKDIMYLLNQYFISTPPTELKDNNQELVENVEFLINFLNISESLIAKKTN